VHIYRDSEEVVKLFKGDMCTYIESAVIQEVVILRRVRYVHIYRAREEVVKFCKGDMCTYA
jgi:hypothetical protein